ncbi:DUF2637 domain-containing protein [Streptomyces liangshanensis]|uniref:DUF2637 domain-containing protein n=1 Tax=Streptomyces liangshanensis TaxID=2717324 RepID=UPI0036DD6BC9
MRTAVVSVGAGAIVIAAIGFAGSYTAVRDLAADQGFGSFAVVFPIGIDAGIGVLLALDLVLTALRIPYPLLRPTAWTLTAATIAFNGAAAWPDPLGVGMHAVIPLLFVVVIEAARHAVGRIADITADKHMEGVRLTRWLLAPGPTFLLWRRMKLWELRSYDQVITLEQDRLIYRARLQARFGRGWKRKAPIEALMPLRLARTGVPLAATAAAGLAAAGIEQPPALPVPPAVPPALPAVPAVPVRPPTPPNIPPPGAALLPVMCPPRPTSPTPALPAALPEPPLPQPWWLIDFDPAPEVHPDVRTQIPAAVFAAGQPRARAQVHARVPDPADGPAEPDCTELPEPTPARTPDVLDAARQVNAARLAAVGRPASIEILKAELHVGQTRAREIRDLLASEVTL